MKKLSLLLLALVLSVGLVGCSSDEKDTPKENDVAQETVKGGLSFEMIEQTLKDKGYKVNEKVNMMAESIGAKQGIKFKTDKGDLEIYKFDTSSESYKKAKDEKVVTMEGFGDFPIIVNGEFGVIDSNLPEGFSELFKSL